MHKDLLIKDLLILCHPDQPGLESTAAQKTDLKDSSKRNAQRFGVWMAGRDLIPDEVICDPSLASRTAAEKSSKAAGIDERIVRTTDGLNGASVAAFVDAIEGFDPGTDCALIAVTSSVAKRFVAHACRGKLKSDLGAFVAETDVLVHLRLPSDWKQIVPGSGELVQTIGSEALPKTFPFPDVRGTEQRPRPAYYYRQSAVIPFRVREGMLEILVVSTSKRKRWGVPKGIHDPGKTAQASAANEAMEEAGVLGNVLDVELGGYTYAKWGATCVVKVFPMEVTEVLAPGDWPESYRGREWLSPAAAAERVHQDELKRMIKDLPRRLAKENRDENHHG